MTQQEFDDLRFCAGMIAEYDGHWYDVISCSFPERLFGLGDVTTKESADLLWVRCENVTQVKTVIMREIKFRGRRLDNKAWVYGALFAQGGKAYIITDLTPLGFIKYEVDPATGGQYWHRINGKELFDGDVFRFKFGDEYIVRTVRYSEEQAAFCIIYERWPEFEHTPDASWWQKFGKDIEIIGNIHDNPELLKIE